MGYKLKKMKNGMITVEASIVVPIVMLVIASVVFMTFWAHDIVSVRSGSYSLAVGQEKEGMPSLFVIKPKIVKTETANMIKVTIMTEKKGNTTFLRYLINENKKEILAVQKSMNMEILYAGRAIIDIKGGS